MKYHVDFNNLEECRNFIEKEKNAFKDELDIITKAKKNVQWKGQAYNAFYNTFTNNMFDLYNIPKILELYIKFLDISLNDYQDGLKEIKKQFDELMLQIKRYEELK